MEISFDMILKPFLSGFITMLPWLIIAVIVGILFRVFKNKVLKFFDKLLKK